MWIDCYEVFVNMERVDYISFDYEENVPTAYVFFNGSPQPLKLQSDSLEEMVKYFANLTIGGIKSEIALVENSQ